MTSAPAHRLITVGPSHFCEKARWALDHAGVGYREEPHCPIWHWLFTLAAGGGRTVPVLVTPRGVLETSTSILQFADEANSERARRLYPADPVDRAKAEALEQHFGAELGPATAGYGYVFVLQRPDLVARFGAGAAALERRFFSASLPLIRLILWRIAGASAHRAPYFLERVDTIFAEVGERIDAGARYLVGEQFSAADLTFAALAAPLILPAGYPVPWTVDELPTLLAQQIVRLRASSAGRFALRLYAEHRGQGQPSRSSPA